MNFCKYIDILACEKIPIFFGKHKLNGIFNKNLINSHSKRTEIAGKTRKSPEKSVDHRKSQKSSERYGNLKKCIFCHINVFFYKLIIQWSFIKCNAQLFFGKAPPFPPLPWKCPENYINLISGHT